MRKANVNAKTSEDPRRRRGERGAATLFMLLMAAALMILLSVAVRGWHDLWRDNRRMDAELRQRAATLQVEGKRPSDNYELRITN